MALPSKMVQVGDAEQECQTGIAEHLGYGKSTAEDKGSGGAKSVQCRKKLKIVLIAISEHYIALESRFVRRCKVPRFGFSIVVSLRVVVLKDRLVQRAEFIVSTLFDYRSQLPFTGTKLKAGWSALDQKKEEDIAVEGLLLAACLAHPEMLPPLSGDDGCTIDIVRLSLYWLSNQIAGNRQYSALGGSRATHSLG
ncbi:hypothetical protein C8J56DRAFT_899916 [Mycena floridula]|nr:hypothetical protein C8J56DRAFT_899916 [Mycena floridula]